MSTLPWEAELPTIGAGCWICSVLPRRMRRIVALTSLYGFIASDTFDESMAVERLNSELSLSSCKDALRLPTRFAQHLRQTKQIQENLIIPHDRGALYRMAVAIVNRMPEKMRYGPLAEMRIDVARVLQLAI